LAKRSNVRQHNLREILNILGEDVDHSTQFHVHYSPELVSENPFPYPFRGNNNGLIMILQGKLKIQINLEIFTASADDIVFFSSHLTVHILEVLEPIKTIGLVFTEEYALTNIISFKDINILRFFSSNEMPVLSLGGSKKETVLYLLESMYFLNSVDEDDNYYRKEKTFHYFNLLGLELLESYRADIQKVDIKTSRKKDIIQSFLSLLSLHVIRERTVKFYADKLYITSGHLSKLLKEASGTTARDIIEDAVVMEARNLLLDTSLPLSQIAEKLNFSDQSFFGKFFKKKMKVTPKFFRNQYK